MNCDSKGLKKLFVLRKIFDSKGFFIFLLIFCTAIGVFSVVLLKPYTSIAIFFLLSIYMMVSSGKRNLLILLFFLPLDGLFLTFSLSISSLYTVLVGVYLLIVLFKMIYSKKRFPLYSLLSIAAFVPFFLITIVVTIYYRATLSIFTAISFYVYLLLPVIVSLDYETDKSFESTISFYLYGCLASLLIGLVLAFIPFTRSNYLVFIEDDPTKGWTLFKTRFSGLCVDQNEMSLIMIIPMSFFLLFPKRFSNKKTLYFITLGIFLLTLLGESKSFLICFALLLIFIAIRVAIKKFEKTLLIVAVITSLFALMILFYGTSGIALIFSRFIAITSDNESLMDVITTGRYSIWVYYNNYLFSNPLLLLFGQGVRSSYYNKPQNAPVCHNFVINLVWDFGLLGTMFFIVYSFVAMDIHRNKNIPFLENFESLGPLIIFLVFGFGLTLTGSIEMDSILLLTYILNRENNRIFFQRGSRKTYWMASKGSLSI
jgi:hypothetical protein